MLGAAAALDAGVSLEADQPGQIGPGHQAEVFVPAKGRNLGKAAARQKDGGRAQNQVQVLGVGDEREKGEQSQRVTPPQDAGCGCGIRYKERRQVGGHQDEDQQGNDAGLIGKFCAEPLGPDEEAADEEAEDADGADDGEGGGEVVIEAADWASGREKAESEDGGAVVERDEGKGAEGPEDKSVGKTRKRALADDLGLAEHLPYKFPDALADGEEAKGGVLPGFQDFVEDQAEAARESSGRGDGQCGKKQLLKEGEVLRLGQG